MNPRPLSAAIIGAGALLAGGAVLWLAWPLGGLLPVLAGEILLYGALCGLVCRWGFEVYGASGALAATALMAFLPQTVAAVAGGMALMGSFLQLAAVYVLARCLLDPTLQRALLAGGAIAAVLSTAPAVGPSLPSAAAGMAACSLLLVASRALTAERWESRARVVKAGAVSVALAWGTAATLLLLAASLSTLPSMEEYTSMPPRDRSGSLSRAGEGRGEGDQTILRSRSLSEKGRRRPSTGSGRAENIVKSTVHPLMLSLSKHPEAFLRQAPSRMLKNSPDALRHGQGERKSSMNPGRGSAHAELVEAWGGVFPQPARRVGFGASGAPPRGGSLRLLASDPPRPGPLPSGRGNPDGIPGRIGRVPVVLLLLAALRPWRWERRYADATWLVAAVSLGLPLAWHHTAWPDEVGFLPVAPFVALLAGAAWDSGRTRRQRRGATAAVVAHVLVALLMWPHYPGGVRRPDWPADRLNSELDARLGWRS